MVMHKTAFFLLLLFLSTAPFGICRVIWLLHSRRAEGWMGFKGMGYAGDQIPLSYSVIYFRYGKDTVWFNSMANPPLQRGQRVPVRYQVGNPSDARVDLFVGIWGDIVVYAGIPVLMLLVLFVHRAVVPWGARVRLTRRKPFIEVI